MICVRNGKMSRELNNNPLLFLRDSLIPLTGMVPKPLSLHRSTRSMLDYTAKRILYVVAHFLWFQPVHPMLLMAMVMRSSLNLITRVPNTLVLPMSTVRLVLPLLSHLVQQLSKWGVLSLLPLVLESPAVVQFAIRRLMQHSVLLHSSPLLGMTHIFHVTSWR